MRVVLADDSLILREGLARLLDEAGFEVVGQASTGKELLDQLDTTQPDVAIVDIGMPPGFTISAVQGKLRLPALAPSQ